MVTVGEECGTGDALRAVAAGLDPSVDGLVVYSGDLVTDAPLPAMLVAHRLGGALATALVSARRVAPSSETKPGKAPKVRGCGGGGGAARPRRRTRHPPPAPGKPSANHPLARKPASPTARRKQLPQPNPFSCCSPAPYPPIQPKTIHVFGRHPAPSTPPNQKGVDYLGLDPSRRLLLFSPPQSNPKP